jgi:hypothetical protein
MTKITITIDDDGQAQESAELEVAPGVLAQLDIWRQQAHRKVPETGLPLYASAAEALRGQMMEFFRSVLDEHPTPELEQARSAVIDEKRKAVPANVIART